jgi:hypothetical protein
MKIHVILVHGFNVKDGGVGSVGKLKPFFEKTGCTAEMFDYGWFGLFHTRWNNGSVAERLNERVLDLKSIGHKVIVVGHSNGATITHLSAQKHQCPIDRAVYINPALDHDIKIPESIKEVDVWHNPHDRIVTLSKFRLFHLWGEAGRYGLTRFDYRCKNYNVVNFLSGKGGSHSKPFSDDAIETLAPAIVNAALLTR